ncbi:tail fiber protein [Paenibacillus sp. FSL R7-0026]|uniref:tail fiber protein n=1 Tax=Paenibacillus sp. FSL R7-0026 TaxID=2921668 RepID=UPI0030FB5A61
MPKETDRLKLPLPLGNENVTRESINGIFEKIDAGVATQEEVEALRRMMGEMDIPDASLMVKGKVKLSNKTNGTSQTDAATEKAVNDALQEAINAAATDATTKANAAIASVVGADSSNTVQNSAANMGLYGWSDIGSSPWSVIPTINYKGLKYFAVNGSVAANQFAILDSAVFAVGTGLYNLQAMFYTTGMTAGNLFLEVKNAADDVNVGSLLANLNTGWHRKSSNISIPAGVTNVKIRLVVSTSGALLPGSIKAITRIKFAHSQYGYDLPYTAEADDLALFEYTKRQNVWGAL